MPPRSSVLARQNVAATGATVLASVPVGEVEVIKSATLYNYGGAALSVQLDVYDPLSGRRARLYDATLGAGAHDRWDGWVVAVAGDQLLVTVSIGTLAIQLSGIVLT